MYIHIYKIYTLYTYMYMYQISTTYGSPAQEEVILLSVYLELFLGVVSCRSYLFRVVPCFTNYKYSQNILTYTFTKNEFNVKFDYKVRQKLKQSGAALMY